MTGLLFFLLGVLIGGIFFSLYWVWKSGDYPDVDD